jgi:hypothetical protein
MLLENLGEKRISGFKDEFFTALELKDKDARSRMISCTDNYHLSPLPASSKNHNGIINFSPNYWDVLFINRKKRVNQPRMVA